jgi:hypothetical protein
MKLAAVAVLMFILLAAAASQSSQKSEITLNPVLEGPLNLQVGPDWYLYTKGHWVSSTDPGHTLPIVAELTCNKKAMTCTELSASLTPIGGQLVLDPFIEDYKVSRWNETDIVAFHGSSSGCGLGHTLKILLKDKRVMALDAPTEPVTEKTPEICRLTSSYELKDGNSFWTKPTLR